MSLARQLSTLDRHMEGNAARALPPVEREPRTAPRPAVRRAKRSVAGLVLGSLGWLAVLALSLFVVHRNTLVLSETHALTGRQEALALLDQQIMEKSSRVNIPIEEVEKWAKAHNMTRPVAVKTAVADPNAAAPLPEQSPVAVAAEPAPGKGGLYGTVRGFFARFTEARAAAAPRGN
ncbi:MAG TPA: hypothetical protein VD969_22735 [Symbiobacteriaceae bacterium]|nr:hypothetical protein [Symbiobacteriaceae bacterium]